MSHAFNNETCTMLVNSENSASVVAQHTDRPSRKAAQVPTALLLKQLPASGPRPWAPAPHGILRSSSWCLPPWPAQVQEPQQCRKWVSSKQNLKKKKKIPAKASLWVVGNCLKASHLNHASAFSCTPRHVTEETLWQRADSPCEEGFCPCTSRRGKSTPPVKANEMSLWHYKDLRPEDLETRRHG